jgi:hypothetical protein
MTGVCVVTAADAGVIPTATENAVATTRARAKIRREIVMRRYSAPASEVARDLAVR